MDNVRVGLVLSGGGAKGAYQVGVLKALQEAGILVDALSGASIGALNGAVLACAPSLDQGVERLEILWRTLAAAPPLRANMPVYLRLLIEVGLQFQGQRLLSSLASEALSSIPALVQRVASKYRPWLEWLSQHSGMLKAFLGELANHAQQGLLSTDPVHRLMDEYLDIDSLADGIPLYASVYRSNGAMDDLIRGVFAELNLADNSNAEFLHIQSLAPEMQRKALLASAAIPLLFEPQEVDGVTYTDGGLGGWGKMQGNTPITPLLQASCNLVIVTHLSDGSLWCRQDFPDATILEIRPQRDIARNGTVRDLAGFNPQTIETWMEQGYEDAKICLNRVIKPIKAQLMQRITKACLTDSETALQTSETAMRDAMKRLKS